MDGRPRGGGGWEGWELGFGFGKKVGEVLG